MICTTNDGSAVWSIRRHEQVSHKYLDAMAMYIDIVLWGRGDDGDRHSGGCDSGYESLTQYGKRILVTDDQGFVECVRFATIDEADQIMDATDEAMYALEEYGYESEEWHAMDDHRSKVIAMANVY